MPSGRPPPEITWFRAEQELPSNYKSSPIPNVLHNQLVIPRLQRPDLHAVFSCQASNTNITLPVQTSITVEMHLKPISVSILSSNNPLSADRTYELTCQSVGSRPPAKITWWKDNKQLEDSAEKISSDGNVTTSTLIFKPTVDDHEKILTCRADNPVVKGGAEEDTLKLDVFYVPQLQLELGKNLNPDDIEETDDVYFECKVKANPYAYKVVWKHNGLPLQHNQKAGIILSNQLLALQNVKKSQAGAYSCVASNVEGDGESNVVNLKVMYKPICRPDQKRVYGVARNEEAKVVCEVESFPLPDSFKWSFNNTAETIDVPQGRYHSGSRSMSTLSYRPISEMDYGTVMCWASNTAGQQLEPCVFHIIAAGHPDSPFNCTLVNQTTVSLEVECLEGFDGGQQQWFMLEVRDLQTNFLQANISSKFPVFSVNHLLPGQLLRLSIYAVNNKGKSDPILLEGFTLKVAEKQTGTPVTLDLAPVLGYLVGGCLLILIMALIAAIAWRRSQHKSPERPAALALKEKVALPLRSDVDDLYEMDDKNPDVIPCNKDSDYQLVSEAPTPGLNNQVTPEAPPYEETATLKRNNVQRNGDIYDNYKKNRFPTMNHNPPNEVTYAELCMVRPTTLENNCKPPPPGVPVPPPRHRDEPTIYAQIDHSRRAPVASPLSPTLLPTTGLKEIVTVRTPLMGSQQESCV